MSVIVIGAGHAGVSAAVALRKLDKDVKITLLSAEGEFPYQRPPLSKKSAFSENPKFDLLQGREYYKAHNLDLRINSKVDSIEKDINQITLSSGESLNYSQLIIATGCRLKKLNTVGAELAKSLYSTDDTRILSEALAKARSVIVIGGGFIGCEIASGARNLGKEVTLLEVAPAILGRSVAPIFASEISFRHQNNGIQILPNSIIHFITDKGVQTESGLIESDLIVSGIGAVPNTELAHKSALVVDNGIVVNKSLQSSDDNIFAIGDVVNFPFAGVPNRLRLESIQNANDQAKVAARNIVAIRTNESLIEYSPVPWFWSDQGDLKLQMVGIGSLDAKHYVLENQKEDSLSVLHFVEDELTAIDTLNHGINHLCGRKLLAMTKPISLNNVQSFNDDLKALVNHFR